MESVLYLVHRIPYPPNKGDKIRSYNILKFLAQRYRVHLGAFVDDAEDFKYQGALNEICTSLCLLPLNTKRSKLKSLTGFFRGEPLTVPYYYDSKMQQWVDDALADNAIDKALVFSSSMAQYLSEPRFSRLKRLIDFVDIDSDKWAQYKTQASSIMKLIYGYEARMLLKWEKQIAHEFNASFFVSEKEADMFKRLAPDVCEKISYFNNGVDTDYFSPNHKFESPFVEDCRPIVFTGAMDYWANVDAVVWFANNVFPAIREKVADVTFYIVGSKPDDKVKVLASLPNVVVTGAVDDVRPYQAHAEISVAPMRIARGIQNKVLEAMAMALPVVASPQGYEGIEAVPGQELLVVDEVDAWITTIINLLASGDVASMAKAARQRVIQDYSWQGSLKRLEKYLE